MSAEIRARVDQALRDVDDGERLEAEEVELDEAGLLDVVLVVLGDVPVGLAVLEDRDVIPERAFADDDAGGVLAGVAREAFELDRLREQLLDRAARCRSAP